MFGHVCASCVAIVSPYQHTKNKNVIIISTVLSFLLKVVGSEAVVYHVFICYLFIYMNCSHQQLINS